MCSKNVDVLRASSHRAILRMDESNFNSGAKNMTTRYNNETHHEPISRPDLDDDDEVHLLQSLRIHRLNSPVVTPPSTVTPKEKAVKSL